MKKFFCLIMIVFTISLIVSSSQVSAQASISIDHVDGLMLGKVQPDQPLKFNLRFTNNTGYDMYGIQNGFRVYLSNNGELLNGTYEPPFFNDMLPEFYETFNYAFQLYDLTDGVGQDILGMLGMISGGGSIQNGYDQVVVNISTSVFSEHAGDSLCIDSTFYGASGTWQWVGQSAASPYEGYYPDWGGPYCYEILPSCCIGIRGNYNNSPDDQIEISDLVFLVNYMFLMGAAPVCDEEADINGDGSIDIADLVVLVAYMFQGGPPPATCP